MKIPLEMWFHRTILRHKQQERKDLAQYFDMHATMCSCTHFWGRARELKVAK